MEGFVSVNLVEWLEWDFYSMTDAQFKEAFNNLATDVASTLSMENALLGKGANCCL